MKRNNILVFVLVVALLFVAACSARNSDSSWDSGHMNESPLVNVVDSGVQSGIQPGAAFDSSDWAMEADDWGHWEESESMESWEDWSPEPIPEAPRPPAPAANAANNNADFTAWETPEIPQPAAVERRVIRNSDISVDTLNFDETVSNLERIVAINGGFIETSGQRLANRHGFDRTFWYAEYVIRVPVARFDTANRDITALGQVVRFTTSSEDVTMLFLDLQSRLNIRVEEERRIEAMRDAATDLRDLLILERELSDLRVIVDRYRRRMTEIDQLASFSTIRLSLREVVEIIIEEEEEDEEEEYIPYIPEEPPADGFGTRIASAFGSSVNFSVMLFEAVAVIIATLILPLTLFALPIFIGYVIYKKKYIQKLLARID